MPRTLLIEREEGSRTCTRGAHVRDDSGKNTAEANRKPGIWRRLPFTAVALFIVSLACFTAGVSVHLSLTSTIANTATFALRGTGITAEEAASICSADDERSIAAPFVFWSEKDDAEAHGSNDMGAPSDPSNLNEMDERSDPTNPNDSNTSSLALAADLRYCGDIGLLLPDIPAYPAEPGNPPTSSGVGTESASTAAAYDRLTTARLDADGFPITAEAIGSIMQVQCDELDYHLLSLVSYAALFLYPAALCIQAALCCRRIRKMGRHSVLAQAIGYALPSIAAIAATATFATSLSEFGSYFPTRWSGFLAWGEAVNDAVQSFARVVFSAQTVIDVPIVATWALSLVLAAASVAFAIAAKGRFELWNLRIETNQPETNYEQDR